MLRIDVDKKGTDKQGKTLPYGIPKDNPFVDYPHARPEIWAYGVRNPWRLSFDRKTGECWLADVGQDLWEEVNIVTSGANCGWNMREGKHPFGIGGVHSPARICWSRSSSTRTISANRSLAAMSIGLNDCRSWPGRICTQTM